MSGKDLVSYTREQAEKYGLETEGVIFREEQTLENCLAAIVFDESNYHKVVIPTPTNFPLLAANKNGYILQYIQDQTPELCMVAVKQDWDCLKYVKDQTPELCTEAVLECGLAIEHVRDKTFELCMEAVQTTPFAIWFIPEFIRNDDVWENCIKREPEIVIQLINSNDITIDQYRLDKYIKIAVSLKGSLLNYVSVQTEELCLLAVKNDLFAMRFVQPQFIDYVLANL